jgi:hypothetical protein
MTVPNAGAPAQTAVSRSASSALAGSGPLPTAVLRSPAPGFAPSGQRPQQAPLTTQPGLAGPRIVAPPKMPPGFPRRMLPGTAARSTAPAPGSRAPVEGVSRR